jgi:hypothetical protein
VVVRLFEVRRAKRPPAVPNLIRIFVTTQFVCLSWVFFRAANLESALAVLSRIASGTASAANLSAPLLMIMAIGIAAHYIPKHWFESSRDLFAKAPFFAQAGALALLVMAIRYVAATGAAPFIYTKF